jgi:hypothetical protein
VRACVWVCKRMCLLCAHWPAPETLPVSLYTHRHMRMFHTHTHTYTHTHVQADTYARTYSVHPPTSQPLLCSGHERVDHRHAFVLFYLHAWAEGTGVTKCVLSVCVCVCSLLPARMGRGYRRDELCPESVCVSECLCSLLPARMSRGYRRDEMRPECVCVCGCSLLPARMGRGYRRDEMRPVCVCVNVLFSSTRTCGQRVQA